MMLQEISSRDVCVYVKRKKGGMGFSSLDEYSQAPASARAHARSKRHSKRQPRYN
jgi:hypothetical protein